VTITSASPEGWSRGESWHRLNGLEHCLSPRQSPCHSPISNMADDNWEETYASLRTLCRPTTHIGERRHSSAGVGCASFLSCIGVGHSTRGRVTEDPWLSALSTVDKALALPFFQFSTV
jgi:nuclear factor of activated T-cells 3